MPTLTDLAVITGIAAWVAAFAIGAAVYAEMRRRDPQVWAVFGALIGPVALVLLGLAPPGDCPDCGTRVAGWPSVCDRCGRDLRPGLLRSMAARRAPRTAAGPDPAPVPGADVPAVDPGPGTDPGVGDSASPTSSTHDASVGSEVVVATDDAGTRGPEPSAAAHRSPPSRADDRPTRLTSGPGGAPWIRDGRTTAIGGDADAVEGQPSGGLTEGASSSTAEREAPAIAGPDRTVSRPRLHGPQLTTASEPAVMLGSSITRTPDVPAADGGRAPGACPDSNPDLDSADLLKVPGSVASTADDFFVGLHRRVERPD